MSDETQKPEEQGTNNDQLLQYYMDQLDHQRKTNKRVLTMAVVASVALVSICVLGPWLCDKGTNQSPPAEVEIKRDQFLKPTPYPTKIARVKSTEPVVKWRTKTVSKNFTYTFNRYSLDDIELACMPHGGVKSFSKYKGRFYVKCTNNVFFRI